MAQNLHQSEAELFTSKLTPLVGEIYWILLNWNDCWFGMPKIEKKNIFKYLNKYEGEIDVTLRTQFKHRDSEEVPF